MESKRFTSGFWITGGIIITLACYLWGNVKENYYEREYRKLSIETLRIAKSIEDYKNVITSLSLKGRVYEGTYLTWNNDIKLKSFDAKGTSLRLVFEYDNKIDERLYKNNDIILAPVISKLGILNLQIKETVGIIGSKDYFDFTSTYTSDANGVN